MVYANKYFVELMECILFRYGQITTGYLMKNQDKMKATYNVKDPIETLFDQMQTGQEFTISGNYPFSDRHLAEMGVSKILAKQEYKYAYHMWKIISYNDHTWVRLKEHQQKVYLDREELDQTEGASRYVRDNNMKHVEMEDSFMNFTSVTVAHDTAFTELTMKNGNLSNQLRQKQDQIWELQTELCNIRVELSTQTTEVKGNSKV